MIPVEVRKVRIGEGVPKICVPIVGKTKQDILCEAKTFEKIPIDVAEWRSDWFEDVMKPGRMEEVLCALREILKDIPLLFTFRTQKEGGERVVNQEEYITLNKRAAESGCVDMVDVEAFTGDEAVKAMIATAHLSGVKVIVSSHDFEKTPEKEELIERLCRMQKLDPDIVKLAVMPQSREDVLALLCATEEMTRRYAECPVVTMAMSGIGAVSRLCGEVFGSAMTFGAAGKASAPGQLAVEELYTAMQILHRSL